MKYLKHFPVQLRKFRELKRLSIDDIAQYCHVDPTTVAAWEEAGGNACYPSLDNLLDLCLNTGTALEYFIDIPNKNNRHQLELPGLQPIEEGDITESLAALDAELEKFIPAEDEQELLRRYRRSDPQNRELILQLIAN